MSRGGARQGAPGKSYGPSRSDLNTNRQPAGPLATPAASPLPTQTGPAAALPTQTAAAPAGPPSGPPVPGSLGTFGPSQRPGEPLTHGLPTGPGGGPEVLAQPGFTVDPLVQASALLASIPAVHQTPALRALAAAARASVANGANAGIAQGGGQ